MAYVDLSRRFRDLTTDELEAPEVLAWMNESSFLRGLSWSDLLAHPRVVLLAEAGSGKTVEMREQAAALRARGKPAFFLALESLAREPPEVQLRPPERQALEAWKVDGQSTAWFFLDAVDEMNLVDGKLERALGRLASTVDGGLHRVHVVISSRPTDWRPVIDMATLQEALPIVVPQPIREVDADEIFLSALREPSANKQGETEQVGAEAGPRVVVLLPLSERQIVLLAQSVGIADTTALVAEIRRRDAWTFARRPLDLTALFMSWQAEKKLGTRAELHLANVIGKLRDDPGRKDRGVLSAERARCGAERLALALALTRTRTIRSPEHALTADRAGCALEAAEILTDWTPEECQSLLRRPLFDPATYGRIRFHHRSVQEYLAACRLLALRKRGVSTKSLHRLLFAERYGVPVVIPSMQAIVAWLALWEDGVRRELMQREPETLLSMGDPESLAVPTRGQVLRAFCGLYGNGGFRGVSIPFDEVRRLAHPDLAPVVRELWHSKPSNEEVSTLLLELIWLGRMRSCFGIARTVAFDAAMPDLQRVIAIKAISVIGKPEDLQEVARSILDDPKQWPAGVIGPTIDDLFPGAFGVHDLIALLRRAGEDLNSAKDFSVVMDSIAETIEVPSLVAVELREALANLIWQSRQRDQKSLRLTGHFDALAPALARLCDRFIGTCSATLTPEDRLIWACVLANRFAGSRSGVHDSLVKLKEQFRASPGLREAAFWAELSLAAETLPECGDRVRCFHAEHESIVEPLGAADRPWLIAAVRSSPEPARRVLALYALARLWQRSGREQVGLDQLQEAVNGDARLAEVLGEATRPPEPDAEDLEWHSEQRRRQEEHARAQQQRLETWRWWKEGICADPEAAFTLEAMPATLENLHTWLAARQPDRRRFGVWDEGALRDVFGEKVTGLAEKAFRAFWREQSPIPWSQRPAESRNSVKTAWIEGFTGLAAETASDGWASRLAPDEARVAAAYAASELNGFPPWLKDLASHHGGVVDGVIGGELTAELAGSQEHPDIPMLQNLANGDLSLKILLAPRLLAALPEWPATFRDEERRGRSEHHLRSVLVILREVVEHREAAAVARICGRRFSADPRGPLAMTWLKGLFRFDPESATEALEKQLSSLPEPRSSDDAVTALASLFGVPAGVLIAPDVARRARLLGRLVRCAYQYVPPEEHQTHEGIHAPDARDAAETAKRVLLGALVDIPGAETHEVLGELAEDPHLADLADSLRLLAGRRAAADADGPALLPRDVVALEERFEVPAHDRDGLFDLMVDRLDDLAHGIVHDDLSDRQTLLTIEDENEMQRTLARRLRDSARAMYLVLREEEVADRKETDIRLAATRGEQKAVIEVKIATSWTLRQLEHALSNQLVGQYLRDDTCKAGCLLLTYNGRKKKSWCLATGESLSFGGLIDHLQRLATELERKGGYEVRLAVFPLDLTDPVSRVTGTGRTVAARRGRSTRSGHVPAEWS
jgi:hypothetical protein